MRGLPGTLQKLALAFEFSCLGATAQVRSSTGSGSEWQRWTECKITSDGFAKLVAGLPKAGCGDAEVMNF